MFTRRRVAAGGLTLAMLLAFSATAMAERSADEAAIGEGVTDRETDRTLNATKADRPNDRPVDEVSDRPSDRPTDRITDHPTDRRVDRCHLLRTDRLPLDCIDDDRPRDLNIRHLIYRLIHAGEWAKLVRLLHWLGWI